MMMVHCWPKLDCHKVVVNPVALGSWVTTRCKTPISQCVVQQNCKVAQRMVDSVVSGSCKNGRQACAR